MLTKFFFQRAFSLTKLIASDVFVAQNFPSTATNKKIMPIERQRLVSSILRVDHAGELAADRIYAGQLLVLKNNSQLVPIIERMWKEEKAHLDIMERLLVKYNTSPTIFAPFCSLAGFVLGAGTAMLGEKSAMACTVAVEELIGNHYNNQIKELLADDPVEHTEILQVLSKMRDDELEHHDTGVHYKGLEAPFYQFLKIVIQTGCKGAIWVTQKI